MWVLGGRGTTSIPFWGYRRNDVWYSADGRTWTRMEGALPFQPTDELASVVFHDEMWVVDGLSSRIWHSPDGANWTIATESPFGNGGDAFHRLPVAVTLDDRIWLIQHLNSGFIGGSQVLYSHDGIAWTEVVDPVPVDARYDELATTAVVLDGTIWATRSYLDRSHLTYAHRNDVWYSGPDSYRYPDVRPESSGVGGAGDIVTLITDIIREVIRSL
jgi:hypothetical protein